MDPENASATNPEKGAKEIGDGEAVDCQSKKHHRQVNRLISGIRHCESMAP
jgi:hypothetical protein